MGKDLSMVRYLHAAPSDSALMLNFNITHTEYEKNKMEFPNCLLLLPVQLR